MNSETYVMSGLRTDEGFSPCLSSFIANQGILTGACLTSTLIS